ncbi:MAG: hypothetical protein AAFY76_23175, partial [Cyanobacteria bacterium J06649_11]
NEESYTNSPQLTVEVLILISIIFNYQSKLMLLATNRHHIVSLWFRVLAGGKPLVKLIYFLYSPSKAQHH